MPRKSKKQKFKGTPFCKVKKEDSFNNFNDSICNQIPLVPTPLSNHSITSTDYTLATEKNHLSTEKMKPFSELECDERSKGYRLIDLSSLNDALASEKYFTEKVIQSKDCKREYDAASYDEKKKTIKHILIEKGKVKLLQKNITALTISLECFEFNYNFFPDSLLKIAAKCSLSCCKLVS